MVCIVPYGDVNDPSLPCCCYGTGRPDGTSTITGVKIKALKKFKMA